MTVFAIGDKVKWFSSFESKVGIVVQVVPPHVMPEPLPTEYGGGLPRVDESYVVEVEQRNHRKPKTYWPRVSALQSDKS